jgi:hypothetical protein
VSRHLVLGSGLDAADRLDQLSHIGLWIEVVRLVHLHPHVLNGVLSPELVLGFGEQHQGEGDLEQVVHAGGDQTTSDLVLQGDLDELEGGAEGLGAHELGGACEDDLEVRLEDGRGVGGVEFLEEDV